MTIETERLENKWTIWCGLPFIPLQRNRQLARNQTEQKRNRKRILLGADAKLVESKSFGDTTFVRENVIPSIQVKWMIYLQFIFAIRQNRICSILSHSALFLICHNRTALYIMLITLAAAVRWGRKKKSNEKYELMSERTGNKSLSTVLSCDELLQCYKSPSARATIFQSVRNALRMSNTTHSSRHKFRHVTHFIAEISCIWFCLNIWWLMCCI